MKELVQILKEKGMTIGSCESLTAGLFTSRMAEVPGASAVLKGGIVTYHTQIKETVAQVSHEVIRDHGFSMWICACPLPEMPGRTAWKESRQAPYTAHWPQKADVRRGISILRTPRATRCAAVWWTRWSCGSKAT